MLDALWILLQSESIDLSNVLIFLPSRRAVRAAEKMFVEKNGGALILPHLVALGEGAEQEDIDNDDNVAYKRLLVKAQYFLAYTAIANVIMLTAVKIDNAGNQQVSDEKMEPLDITESYRLRDFYQHKADYLCKQLQNFILKNRKDYPELSDNDCNSIKTNLYSAATCGIWLGGPRNPVHRSRRRCR